LNGKYVPRMRTGLPLSTVNFVLPLPVNSKVRVTCTDLPSGAGIFASSRCVSTEPGNMDAVWKRSGPSKEQFGEEKDRTRRKMGERAW
jgi:hypothetical protein